MNFSSTNVMNFAIIQSEAKREFRILYSNEKQDPIVQDYAMKYLT